jgi:hypothetical protein
LSKKPRMLWNWFLTSFVLVRIFDRDLNDLILEDSFWKSKFALESKVVCC